MIYKIYSFKKIVYIYTHIHICIHVDTHMGCCED